MALRVTDPAGNEIGNVQPGWSVQEFATPNAPGDTAGGTGTVTFGIGADADDVLLIDTELTFQDDDLGSISGPVRSSGLAGIQGSFTQATYLDKFDAERFVPPCQTGSPLAEIALIMRELGIYDYPPLIPATAIVGYSIPFIGSTYDETLTVGLETLLPPLVSYPNPYQVSGIPGAYNGVTVTNTATSYTLPNAPVQAALFPGFAATPDVSRAFFKFSTKVLAGSQMRIDIGVGSQVSAPNFRNYFTLIWNSTTVQVLAPSENLSLDYTALDESLPVTITVECEPNQMVYSSNPQEPIRYEIGITVTDHTGASVSTRQLAGTVGDMSGDTSLHAYYYEVTGSVDLYSMCMYLDSYSATPDTSYLDPTLAPPFDVTGYTPVTQYGPFPAFVGNCWERVQEICSAFGIEVYPTTTSFGVRNVGTRTVSFDNVQGGGSLSVSRGQAARFVEIEYGNTRNITGSIYSAFERKDPVLAVGPNEEVESVITTDFYPISLIQPQKQLWVSGVSYSTPGVYTIVDSTGLQIVDDQWLDYGGSLTVKFSDEIPNAIVVTLIGPREEIPSTTAPYYVAVSDGVNQYPFLNISGTAVSSDVEILKLATGANPEFITREVANTIRNIFITDLEQALDRGVWTSSALNGVNPTVNFTLPTRAVGGFAIAPGSLVSLRDSVYRVTDATVARTGVTISAIRHATVADFDAVWGSRVVAWFDFFWEAYSLKGPHVYPLKRPSGRVWVALDEGGDPFFVLSPEQAEANVFLDTDGVPYYVEGDGNQGVQVYLDDDFVPYYV